MRRYPLFRYACVLLLSGCATGGAAVRQAPDSDWLAESMRPHRTTPAVAPSGALGTETNPVRVLMPEGEHEYLHRLRCPGGDPPGFERQGSVGIGPYGRIMDRYSIRCAGDDKQSTVFMDMYHCVEETEPVPGFEIVPEIGRRDRSQCD